MPKNIAIFSDGTGQATGRNDSNVLRLCKLLDLSSSSAQVAIYDPGIGTHIRKNRLEAALQASERMRIADSNSQSDVLHWLRIPFELGFGAGATANIKQLYRALIESYEPNDKIYLFGFSRGAFTVRALAGFIYRCGLLENDAVDRIDEAFGWCGQHYTALKGTARLEYRARVDAFRRQCSRPCDIRFLGVWDTVKSVGYLHPMNFPHTRHNPIIGDVRHALALDERRSFYAHTTWGGITARGGGRKADTRRAVCAPASFDLDATDDPEGEPQRVKEVWFPGNHADVGGGYPASAAANNSLRWMIAEARDCELIFDNERYEAIFPKDQDEPVTERHDEMTATVGRKVFWWLADRSPRWDLQNEPPPPITKPTHTPAGPRKIEDSIRDGKVGVHESARAVYDPAIAPWRDLPTEFVSTLPIFE